MICLSLTRIRLQASTTQERHDAINRIREAVTRSGAIILDFKMFSNRSINFVFETTAADVEKLYENLLEIGLKLWQGDKPMDNWYNTTGNTEVQGTLQITFIHDEPDLRIVVPPFDL